MTDAALPEVIRLRDARGQRPEGAAGIGEFWYDPRVWTLDLSPGARVLYPALCSYLFHGEINHRDLRAAMEGSTDGEIASALGELVGRGLLRPAPPPSGDERPVYWVLPLPAG